jgi:hypothetical protein
MFWVFLPGKPIIFWGTHGAPKKHRPRYPGRPGSPALSPWPDLSLAAERPRSWEPAEPSAASGGGDVTGDHG